MAYNQVKPKMRYKGFVWSNVLPAKLNWQRIKTLGIKGLNIR